MGENLRNGNVQLMENFRQFPDVLETIPAMQDIAGGTALSNIVYLGGTSALAIEITAGNVLKIYRNDSITNSAVWTLQSTQGVAAYNRILTTYKGAVIGSRGGGAGIIYWKALTLGTGTFSTAWTGTSGAAFSGVEKFLQHPSDGALYMAHYNKISRATGTADGNFTADVFTLPSDSYVTALAAYNDYLVMGTTPVDFGTLDAVVYLWDRSADTPSYAIQIGHGYIRGLAWIDGVLICVFSDYATNSLYIKALNGNVFETLNYIENKDGTTQTPFGVYAKNGSYLYFAYNSAGLTINGETIRGVFSTDSKGHIAIDVSDSVIGNGNINSIAKIGLNKYAIGYASAGVYTIRANTFNNGGMTATYESGVYGLKFNESQMLQADVSFPALIADQSVSLYFKKADAVTWTFIKTESKVGARILTANSMNPTPSGYEYQWQIISTGDSNTPAPFITGFKWKAEEVDSDIA